MRVHRPWAGKRGEVFVNFCLLGSMSNELLRTSIVSAGYLHPLQDLLKGIIASEQWYNRSFGT